MSEYEPTQVDEYLPATWMPIEELEPNEWNPNVMDDEEAELLKQSILDNGWTQHLVVLEGTTTIIDGEQRFSVAQSDEIQDADHLTPSDVPAGYVPCFALDIGEGQARVSTVQHNRARGSLDANRLKTYLRELDDETELHSVLDRIGVSGEETARLLDEVTAADVIGGDAEFGVPWEPVDRTEMSEEEMEEERSEKVRNAADKAYDSDLSEEERERAKQVAQNSERVNFVLTPDECELANRALGEEKRADSFLNLIHYFRDNELVSEIREIDDEEDPYRELS